MRRFKLKNIVTFLMSATIVIGISCKTEFSNPNAPNEEQLFTTQEGLLGLSVGIRQLYSTTGLRFIIETPAVTTREVGITTTFQNMVELEDGGASLPNFNTNVRELWATLLRVLGMCDNLIENAEFVDLDEGTRSGMIAYGHLFKAMCIGYLAQNYEQVVVETSRDGNADFVSREIAFQEAADLLVDAKFVLNETPISSEFQSLVLAGNIDLLNTINAYLARYQLLAGNYQEAIDAANLVDITIKSEFTYDSQNPNPIWGRVYQNNAFSFRPRDEFGLPASFQIDPNDGRSTFYLADQDLLNQNGLPVDSLLGFFLLDDQRIPVYLPGEMALISAEAYIRLGGAANLANAVIEINKVRTKTDDPFGVNANIGLYTGPVTTDALLNEVYQNRRLELFLTGMSLEDSKRFGRPEPSPSPQVFTDERNRNFYPYPDRERNNNDNTPDDPAI